MKRSNVLLSAITVATAATSVAAVAPGAQAASSKASTAVTAAAPVDHYKQLVSDMRFDKGDQPAGRAWEPINDTGQLPVTNKYAGAMTTYPSGWTEPMGGTYDPSRSLSVKGGVLNVNTVSQGGRVFGGVVMPKASDNMYGERTYGKIVWRMRADRPKSHAYANFTWPANDDGRYEMDQEGSMDPNTLVGGTYHHSGNENKEGYSAQQNQKIGNWHTYQMNWWPGGISMWVDNNLMYRNSTDAPDGQRMRFLIGQTTKMWDSSKMVEGERGVVQVAYVKQWKYNS